MEIPGRSQIYGVNAFPLAKTIEHIYLSLDEYSFILNNVLVSWIRNPATTPDINIELFNPQDTVIEASQSSPVPIENITSPAAFGFVDFSYNFGVRYESDSSIHLIVTGQLAGDPAVINVTCLGLQPFNQKVSVYDL